MEFQESRRLTLSETKKQENFKLPAFQNFLLLRLQTFSSRFLLNWDYDKKTLGFKGLWKLNS